VLAIPAFFQFSGGVLEASFDMNASRYLAAVFALWTATVIAKESGAGKDDIDLSEFVPLSKAKTTTVRASSPRDEGLTGYLGAATELKDGALVISEIAASSAAQRARIEKGDQILSVDGEAMKSVGDFRNSVQAKAPGEKISVAIKRGGKDLNITATLDAASRPRKLGERAILGVRMALASDHVGIDITGVTADKPAALAGLRPGDRIMNWARRRA
jgi:S1-C subfamily serine protease